jgi:hypothetical protein
VGTEDDRVVSYAWHAAGGGVRERAGRYDRSALREVTKLMPREDGGDIRRECMVDDWEFLDT